MSTDNSYQTYLKDCDCENGGIILHEGEAVCRWCRKPYGKGGKMYYEPNHFKASKQPKQERIEVLSMAIKKQWGDGKIDFECQLSYGISKYLFPAIKQAIESVLNKDTVVEDDLSGVEKHFTEKRYTQSEVDTIRRETWEQCRKFIDGHYFYHEGFKYPTLSDYLSSLNSKEVGKEFIGPASLSEHPKCKKEQPTNDNAFVRESKPMEKRDVVCQPLSKQSAPEPSALPTKEWEIVSWINEATRKGDTYGIIQQGAFNEAIAIVEDFPIHSVRRLSDNVVFSLGDEVQYKNARYGWYIIQNFFIKDGGILARSEGNNYCEFVDKYLIKRTPPIVIDEDAFKNRCNVCGDDLVYIRGKYPNTDKRPTCPTCTTERLEQINEISNKDYGKAYQNKS